MPNRLKVLLTTEGTYPYHTGGVSTWCDILINKMNSVDFVVLPVVMNPFISQKFKLPSNVVGLVKVPMWGTEEPSEHVDIPFSQVYLAKRETTGETIQTGFLPLFEQIVKGLLDGVTDYQGFGLLLFQLYEHFRKYDYCETFKSPEVWDLYTRMASEHCKSSGYPEPAIYEIEESLGWLFRFFIILNTPVPPTDIAHSTAAAFCGLPCVISKLKYGTPFMLTEHGVYIREQYIAAVRTKMTGFTRRFFLELIDAVVRVNYAYADLVCPVCEFNIRWEKELGVPADRLKVIYNGIDPLVFAPRLGSPRDYPLVVTTARLDPLKDIETLVRTAAVVKEYVPDVRFGVWGDTSNFEYLQRCEVLRDLLELSDTVTFEGHTDNPADVYNQGDLVLMTSISEGFPFTVIEAMMSGRAVVATDVGGVREAVGECGIVAHPRDYTALALACVELLKDPLRRAKMAVAARERALNHYTTEAVVDEYHRTYKELVPGIEGLGKEGDGTDAH